MPMFCPHRFFFVRYFLLLASVGLLLALADRAGAQDEQPYDLQEHFTKYEFDIPMRDGVTLFTSVYAPKDQSQPYPIMLTRTPYGVGPYGVDRYRRLNGMDQLLAKDGFILVYQDVRGRMGSKGTFVHMRPHEPVKRSPQQIDESTDTYDTIDWLVKHVPNNNGRVGMRGTSYPGFYAAAGMIDAHHALKAVSPQAPIADWFVGDDFHHNGAFYLAHAFRFFSSFGQVLDEPTRSRPEPYDYKTPDGYEFFLKVGPLANIGNTYFRKEIVFWDDLMQHGTYDEFWQRRNLRPHLKNIRPAVMTVGGWFDAEDLFGPLSIYQQVEHNSTGNFNMLVMGPWAHGDWGSSNGDRLGHVEFHAKTAKFFREQVELPFFKHFLKDGADPHLPDALVFETGTNQWRRYDAWPPQNASDLSLFLHAGGNLRFEPPDSDDAEAFDEYVSDPAKPVPFIPNIAIGMTREHMLDDQRFASSRPDVLVYQTEDLQSDMTFAGPISVTLHVSTTGTDSDWVVKLIDVYSGDFPNPEPNPGNAQMGGYQQLVRGEAFRGKFRKSFSEPEPFEPGQTTEISFMMPDVYHTFRRGHRLMLHVQSSWFPLVDRNPQTFVDIYHAQASDFQKATQRVYRSRTAPSSIRVKILR
jgi:putative CocE/NonD family hydrolase